MVDLLRGAGVSWLLALLVALLVSYLLIVTQRWHGRFTHDTMDGDQKFHSDPTPRVGGVAIVAGCLAGWLVTREATLGWLLLAGIPAFAAGFLEDVTKRVGVTPRLLATIASGVLVCLFTGVTLARVNLPGLDVLLQHAWFAIPFTALALAGVANALNIIDGFNGLAGGVAAIIFAALGVIALQQGDMTVAAVSGIFVGTLVGFLSLNFPLGRIFLGDGGAYFVGFSMAWVAVLLVSRNPEVSAWALMLVCAYPVVEMLYSCWRKARRDGHHPSRPDRLHLHMLLHQRLARKWFAGWPANWQNGLTAPMGWVLAAVPAVLAVGAAESTLVTLLGVLAFTLLYIGLYWRLIRFSWRLRAAPRARHMPPRLPKQGVE